MSASFAELILTANTRGLADGEEALDGVARTAKKIQTSVSASMAKMAGSFVAGYVSIQTLSSAITSARGFNAALAETSTLLKGTPAEMAALEAGARSLSKQFGTTATDQVKAYYQAISAGAGGVAEATTLLTQANQLAVGGITDTATAVDVLTTAMNVYKAEGLNAADASDALFVGMKAGKTTITELSSSIGKVLPLSQALGVSFDETVAATAALTKGGLATAEAITGLRAVMSAVLGPSQEAQDLAAQLGINFTAAGLEAKGFAGFMEEVVTKTGGSSEKMQQLFSSVEAVSAALSFAGGAGKSMAEIMAEMESKAGATKSAFDKVNDSLDGRLNRVIAAGGDILLVMGNVLLTLLVPALETAASLFNYLHENAATVGIILGVLASTQIPSLISMALAATAGVTAMSVAMAAASAAGTALGTVLALLGGPIGWAVGAVTLLGVALYSASTPAESIRVSAQASAQSYADAAMSMGLLAPSTQTTAQASKEIQQYLDQAAIAAGGLSEATKRQYGYMVASKAESEKALATANEQLATLNQQNEIARVSAAYGANSLQAAQAKQAAELESLRVQLQMLPVAESVKASIINAAQAGYDLANAAGIASGQISTAAGEAARLAANLGAAAAGASKTADTQLAIVRSQIAAVKAGQDEVVKGKQTALELDKEAYRVAQAAAGVDSSIIERTIKDQFASREELIQAEKELQTVQKARTDAEAASNKASAAGSKARSSALKLEAKELKKAQEEAKKVAQEYQDALSGFVESGVGGAVDYMLDGFKQGFNGLINIAKDTLKQIIAFYIKNKIMLSLGIGTTGSLGLASQAAAGAVGSTGTGGLGILGSLGSSAGGLLGTIGSNLSAGFMSSVYGGLGGLTGAVSGGLSVGGVAGISTAIGAVAAPLLAVAAVFSFFKKKTTELDSGMRVTVDGMGSLVETFKTIETKRYWGLSKKVRTSYQEASASVADPLESAIGSIQSGVLDAASALGVASDAFAGFSYAFQLSTKGMSEDEATAAVTEAFTDLGNTFAGLVPGLKALQADGEGAMDTLSRLVTSLLSVNDVFDLLGHSLYQVSVASGGLSATMVAAFGGVDAMTSAVGTYWSNFYSEGEQLETSTRRLSTALAALGVTMPGTTEEFRALVDGVDTSTDAGATLYAGLISLSSAFFEISSSSEAAQQAIEDAAEATRKSVASMVDSILDSLTLMPTSKAQYDARSSFQINEAKAIEAAQAGDTSAVQSYLSAIQNSSSSDLAYREVAARVLNELQSSTPGFASGGSHLGGLRIVGENGPELEATGPSRIYSASQTSDMLGGSSSTQVAELVAELKSARSEELQLKLRADKQRKTMADTLTKWDKVGTPVIPWGSEGAW